MEILRGDKLKCQTGNPDYFTGQVWQEILVAQPGMSVKSLRVTFAPGARTNWHTHPGGQILYVTAGRGWVQCDGQAKHTISTGDTVIIAPGERHWHGACADSLMQHVAAQPIEDGVDATWLEAVGETEYLG
jgi:quercetin dioxygenase-like cupin family protein